MKLVSFRTVCSLKDRSNIQLKRALIVEVGLNVSSLRSDKCDTKEDLSLLLISSANDKIDYVQPFYFNVCMVHDL